MSPAPLIVATRGSALARAQSAQVAATLQAAGQPAELRIIATRGDAIVDRPFVDIPGKGFFTAELEAALLAGSADLAVHSLKDLPTEPVPQLVLAAITARVDPHDTLLVQPGAHRPGAAGLPLVAGARVGTSAVRRTAQLLALRPDLRIVPLRGNVPTRLRRLQEGALDAIVLAQAGLQRLRLDLGTCLAVPLSCAQMVPAPGQGALALQVRHDNHRLRALCAAVLDGGVARQLVEVERAVLGQVQGGCHAPLGALARADAGRLRLDLFYAPPAPASVLRRTVHADTVAGLQQAALACLPAPP